MADNPRRERLAAPGAIRPPRALFPAADAYAALLRRSLPVACGESSTDRPAFNWSERHLQCLWFDARLRPAILRLAGAETLTILNPGTWNLEAGPDFLNATLLLQPGARQLRGDVEVHVNPADWDSHAHGGNPAYANVIAHVTWFAGSPPKSLPPEALSIPFALNGTAPGVSLDDIDLKAYPHAILPATPRPCEALLRNNPDLAIDLLAAAGQYRLRLKAGRLRAKLERQPDRQQLGYEEIMAALGYKHNQAPFRLLARQMPVAALDVSRETTLARMLGYAALLPEPDAAPDAVGQRFIRELWDLWWRSGMDAPLEQLPWRQHNLRPQNAPARRLAAAAALFSGTYSVLHELDKALAEEDAEHWFSRAQATLMARCRWPFWEERLSLNSLPSNQQVLLLGANRAAAIVTNVLLPLAAAENSLPPGAELRIPPEDISAPMRQTAYHLLGRDHNPAIYAANGVLQQGLLQIKADFCLNAKPDCDGCRLCQALRDRRDQL